MILIKDLENINLYCFDLRQYNTHARTLHCSVFANYNHEIFISDIKIELHYYCEWDGNKWVLVRNLQEIIDLGLEIILENINK